MSPSLVREERSRGTGSQKPTAATIQPIEIVSALNRGGQRYRDVLKTRHLCRCAVTRTTDHLENAHRQGKCGQAADHWVQVRSLNDILVPHSGWIVVSQRYVDQIRRLFIHGFDCRQGTVRIALVPRHSDFDSLAVSG